VWECGSCHRFVSETHFYEDQATGTMAHCADEPERARRAAQCGWTFDDDFGTHERCQLPAGHSGSHQGYRVRWGNDRPWNGAIPPKARVPDGAK